MLWLLSNLKYGLIPIFKHIAYKNGDIAEFTDIVMVQLIQCLSLLMGRYQGMQKTTLI